MKIFALLIIVLTLYRTRLALCSILTLNKILDYIGKCKTPPYDIHSSNSLYSLHDNFELCLAL